MPQGLPIPGDTVRQTWGAGVRAGMYPISDTELYWFTVFNAPEVQQQPSQPTAISISCTQHTNSEYSLCVLSVRCSLTQM